MQKKYKKNSVSNDEIILIKSLDHRQVRIKKIFLLTKNLWEKALARRKPIDQAPLLLTTMPSSNPKNCIAHAPIKKYEGFVGDLLNILVSAPQLFVFYLLLPFLPVPALLCLFMLHWLLPSTKSHLN